MKMIHGTYKMYVGNYDWGCGVDRLLVTFDEAIEGIDAQKMQIKVKKQETDQARPDYPLNIVEVARKVEAAYLCDEKGDKVEGPSRYAMVELYVSPEEGSPLVFSGRLQIFGWSNPYDIMIDYEDEDCMLEIDPVAREISTAADIFELSEEMTPQGILYKYATYSPEQETDTLFVWLHGLGEGQYPNSDARLPLLGRKGCTMAGEAFQSAIGYAHVLVPQCPTYWMDGDGKCTNFLNAGIGADSTSFYTPSLAGFIDRYAAKVGAKKILLAGCSNGGFMCMVLAMNYPGKYKGIVPICEAVPDASISESQLANLMQTPIYLVYSLDDPIVVPEIHELPTIKRLRAAGHPDLHISETEHVIDTSGKYKKADGSPFEYMGHLSWIYYDNNETDDGTGLAAWEWMRQKL